MLSRCAWRTASYAARWRGLNLSAHRPRACDVRRVAGGGLRSTVEQQQLARRERVHILEVVEDLAANRHDRRVGEAQPGPADLVLECGSDLALVNPWTCGSHGRKVYGAGDLGGLSRLREAPLPIAACASG